MFFKSLLPFSAHAFMALSFTGTLLYQLFDKERSLEKMTETTAVKDTAKDSCWI